MLSNGKIFPLDNMEKFSFWVEWSIRVGSAFDHRQIRFIGIKKENHVKVNYRRTFCFKRNHESGSLLENPRESQHRDHRQT